MKIHPTAVVSSHAILGEDVRIGPYAVVGDEVTLGRECVVHAHAVIEGRTTLGEKNIVGHGAVIGTLPQDFSVTSELTSEVRIGDRNTIREYVTIHRGSERDAATVVGDDCYLMVSSHLGHDVRLGNKVVIANGCLLGGYVQIDDGAVLGGGTVFHQWMRIGRLAMVRGGTRFGKDIPPYAMGELDNFLCGLNTVGLRRAGISAEQRLEIKRAFKLVYGSGLNVSQALAKAQESEWSADAQVFFDFIAASKRGICAMIKRKGKAAENDAAEE